MLTTGTMEWILVGLFHFISFSIFRHGSRSVVGLLFNDLKKALNNHNILCESRSSKVYSNMNTHGLSPSFPIGNSFVGLMAWNQRQGT